ncbi:MAG: VCBS repeat-containing protein [Verrucomicrobiales bacterium]|nr:VCBS repeat-containing protein [Verrucomicrobiales bacterium]
MLLFAMVVPDRIGHAETTGTPLPAALGGGPGFTPLPASVTGLQVTNRMDAATTARNQILLNGAGVAAGDVDGDGRCDLYFASVSGFGRLFRNLGDWRFKDVTVAAHLPTQIPQSTGTVLADIDGDGDLDLLVNSVGGGTRLFRNRGTGVFDEDSQAGLIREGGSHSLALADIDGDGDLDLYVANYRTTTVRDNPVRVRLRRVDGGFVAAPPYEDRFVVQIVGNGQGSLVELGEPDVLYLNDGTGRFQATEWTGGRFLDEAGRPLGAPPRDWSLSAMFRDLNGDGTPDLYVCGDFSTPDRIWINQGAGVFRAIAPQAIRHTSWSSMALDVADVNQDGVDDIFVADMLSPDPVRRMVQRGNAHPTVLDDDLRNDRPQTMRNHLFLNRGDNTYSEVACQAGIEASDWTWSAAFLDVDLDGREDLLSVNGHVFDMQDSDAIARLQRLSTAGPVNGAAALTNYPPLNTTNLAFHNVENGRFEDATSQWNFGLAGVSQGLVLADLDGDGDADAVVHNLNQPPVLFRNESTAPRIRVSLRGVPPNTAGVGSRITLRTPGHPQSQVIMAGGRYLSSDEPARTFAAVGLPSSEAVLEVRWPDGRITRLTNPAPNSHFVFDQRDAGDDSPAPPPVVSPFQFAEVSPPLAPVHQDPPYDDAARQRLMSRKLSELGPGLIWLDWDRDGWEDLLIGSGAGAGPQLFKNRGGAGFDPVPLPPAELGPVPDQTGLASWQTANGATHLLVGFSNYEPGPGTPSRLVHYTSLGKDASRPVTVWSGPESIGPIALADVDGDGDLDAFVGGRVAPGRYPEDVASHLLLQDGGAFTPATDTPEEFHNLGLVTSAVWSDWDADGFPELAVATEWGPIRLFWNERGRLSERTRALGLDHFPGWWTGLVTGDFDGDGQMELLAGNWGLNHLYRRFASNEVRVYYGDFLGDGGLDAVEACGRPGEPGYFPWRDYDVFRETLPSLVERFPTWHAFARANVEAILPGEPDTIRHKSASCFEHSLFRLEQDRVSRQPLPPASQVAPVFGVVVGDFDADGSMDAFLAQNFFGVEPGATRLDAGRGLLLRGNGHSELSPVPGHLSGITIYGQQRGAAAADYNHDGRLDLVVSQNRGATRLYENRSLPSGLTVHLIGPRQNVTAIGASVRLITANGAGPRQEIQAGGGYWSQNGATLILGHAQDPQALQVLWPGGRTQTVPWPAGARQLTVGFDDTPAVSAGL